jgi:hypothetical protein
MPRAAIPCPGCKADVLRAVDVDTGEEYLLDATPVDEGHVDVWTAGGRAAARRHGAPSRRQPAHELHACSTVTPPSLPDPYADAPAADQQHGGWR